MSCGRDRDGDGFLFLRQGWGGDQYRRQGDGRQKITFQHKISSQK
jgi:hypothetical protein